MGQLRQGCDPALDDLLMLHEAACRGPQTATSTEAKLWCSCLWVINEVNLVRLMRRTRDPFCWRPFLHVLDRLALLGFQREVEAGTTRLLKIIRVVLDLQGLRHVNIEDVMLFQNSVGSAVIPRPSHLSEE